MSKIAFEDWAVIRTGDLIRLWVLNWSFMAAILFNRVKKRASLTCNILKVP